SIVGKIRRCICQVSIHIKSYCDKGNIFFSNNKISEIETRNFFVLNCIFSTTKRRAQIRQKSRRCRDEEKVAAGVYNRGVLSGIFRPNLEIKVKFGEKSTSKLAKSEKKMQIWRKIDIKTRQI
ncbi:MAG: hypothetical protein IKP73_22150, partial [Bacteroidales bacterium]|nr:hypothetical protein [Bacteroidales bacterium]